MATPPLEGATESSSGASAALKGPLDYLGWSERSQKVINWLGIAFGIYTLITAVGLIGAGFKSATGGQAGELFQFASNPFIALMIGVLATVATQSSTTTTAITVGMVAGGLPIAIAVPVMLGANIGTTITSTLVSLGMVRDKDSFRRAFGAASIHDFYNLLAVAIFLPLELMFGILAKSSEWLANQTSGSDGGIIAQGSVVVEAQGRDLRVQDLKTRSTARCGFTATRRQAWAIFDCPARR